LHDPLQWIIGPYAAQVLGWKLARRPESDARRTRHFELALSTETEDLRAEVVQDSDW